MEKLKIFISWSSDRSLAVAEALRDWLPNLFQMVEPWLSATDMDKGDKWRQVISGELEKADFGLICLTPENLTSPWLLFEAGALAKKEESRVCTYLHDLKYENVKDPLSQFQHTLANEADTKKLLGTINRALPAGASIEAERVAKVFDKWWPDLRDRLATIPKPVAPAPPERTDSDKISEILTRVRALESVVVSREITSASDQISDLRAIVAAKLRTDDALRDIMKYATEKRSELEDLRRAAEGLNDSGRTSELLRVQEQIVIVQVEIQQLDRMIHEGMRSRP